MTESGTADEWKQLLTYKKEKIRRIDNMEKWSYQQPA